MLEVNSANLIGSYLVLVLLLHRVRAVYLDVRNCDEELLELIVAGLLADEDVGLPLFDQDYHIVQARHQERVLIDLDSEHSYKMAIVSGVTVGLDRPRSRFHNNPGYDSFARVLPRRGSQMRACWIYLGDSDRGRCRAPRDLPRKSQLMSWT